VEPTDDAGTAILAVSTHDRSEPTVGVPVNVDNFARAESDRMFAALLQRSGGLGEWHHDRRLAALDEQTVIRQNRDTLYSFVILDISGGATLTLPATDGRYLSAMVVSQDHYINAVLHDPGDHRLTVAEHGTPYVLVAVRTLVDPDDPADLDAVTALQDRLAVDAASATPFVLADYEEPGFTDTRNALLGLAKGLDGFDRAFGRKEDVDPVRHLLGAAAGWGGLPETEAYYLNVNPGLPVGAYSVTVADVPVDAFWSLSVYDADGFFERDEGVRHSINSVVATPNEDGSITVNLGGDADVANHIPIPEGWNFLVRLYRPHAEVLDGRWTFPAVEPR
jgi:hypothetical protein